MYLVKFEMKGEGENGEWRVGSKWFVNDPNVDTYIQIQQKS